MISSERAFVCLHENRRPFTIERMHNPDPKARAITMCRDGAPNADIARKLGIPPGTIGHWKFDDRAKHPELYPLTKQRPPY